MTEDPVNLDARRSSEGRLATDIRRHSQQAVGTDQVLLRQQEEFELQLLEQASGTWQEAATKAQYLIRRYAETADGSVSSRQKLIQRTLADLTRLAKADAPGQ